MGTRACIAETHNGTWRGRYHHWDGYPTALSKTLWNVYRGHFERNITKMLQVLLHDHPAGWSTINEFDWSSLPATVARGRSATATPNGTRVAKTLSGPKTKRSGVVLRH